MRARLLLLAILLAVTAACGYRPDFVIVQMEMQRDESLGLDQVEKLYFLDFQFLLNGSTYDAREQVRKYFNEDFAAYISRKIEPLASERWDKIRRDVAAGSAFDFNAPDLFRELLAAHPRAFYITGRIKAEVKATSVIREVKDEKGVKRNAFVQQQIWDTNSSLYLIDAATGKVVSERGLKEKTTIESGATPHFLYDRLLDRLSEKLAPEFQKRYKRQERYLIFK